jgi:predicted dinucleotide-binding enzyme
MMNMIHKLVAVLMVLGASLLIPVAEADTIAIIGTGNVGGALGPRFASQGHTIIYGSREPMREDVVKLVAETGNGATAMAPVEAAQAGDIIVLAVKWDVAEQVVNGLGDLSGKILIDPINAISRIDGMASNAVDTSAGELIQSWAPDAFVVKAFNTLAAATMVDPAISGGPVTIPLVGNNPEAKARVAGLVESIGFETIDLGPIQYAREVEGMLIVWINARASGAQFDYHLRRVPGE